LDFGGYCRSLGYLSVILDGQTIDDWHCRVSINTTAVCQMQYNSDAVAKYTNLNDPSSWGCYVLSGGQNTYLGGMDLNRYCQSQRYIGVHLDGTTINDWHCQFSINASAACQWQYKRADASASFSDRNDPSSWSCFAAASPSPEPR